MTADIREENAAQTAHAAAADNHYYETTSIHSVQEGVMEQYTEKPPPPARRRFYRQKRYWIMCSILTAVIVVIVVLLIVFVFFPMIAQGIMNKAKIDVESAGIGFAPPEQTTIVGKRQQYDMNSTFFMDMQAKLSHTGPFSADITFHNPIEVYYNDTMIGHITLPPTHVSGGSGMLKAVTAFEIANTTYFASFTKDMLAKENFIWVMKGKLDITALTRTAVVNLNKEIHLKGMNGFPEVSIQSFQLPSDAPGGGIVLSLGTLLVSPSPIQVQLGTISLGISYDGLYLGTVQAEDVTLAQGNNSLPLKGVIIPQPDPINREKIGVMFSNYLSGKPSLTSATGLSALPNGKDPIGWLSEGFQSVQLNVQLQANEPLNIIRAVNMGTLDLAFTPETAYAPVASAPAVVADYAIPFGFSLNITQTSQEILLGTDEAGYFATLSIPLVPTLVDPAAGKLQFAFNNRPIAAVAGSESKFDGFTYSLTASDLYTFKINGTATVVTQTPIGDITINGISFVLPTSLHGLQFLNSTPTVVTSVDMTGGTTAGLLLAIGVELANPADFSIATGDVNFALQGSGVELGNVLLSNLSLARGSNNVSTLATFDPNRSPVGSTILNTFVMGQNNDVSINGFSGSTNIASLQNALGAISLGITLPGLPATLVQSSKLTVYETSPTDGVVGVQVSIANPFSASLAIPKVTCGVTFQGMPLGNINQDISSAPIVIEGHSTTLSAPLSMSMNIEPAAIALLIRQLAVAASLDTRTLDAMLGMGGFQVAGMESVTPTAALFDGFNISSYVMQAMGALAADLQMEAGLNVGEYSTTLAFSQSAVKVESDDTVTRLIPIVGKPIVQQIVDGAVFTLETVLLSDPADSSFQVQLKGSITNTGPMSAEISFPTPLSIAWQGRVIGSVAMPTITTQPDVGASFDIPAAFTVRDQQAMGDFAGYLINNADFVWDITCDGVAVNALGFQFTGITMQKIVTLKGANGFKDAVVIEKFDLPSNDPENGITLLANTIITNPSQVGFVLPSVEFSAFFKDVKLGPLFSDGVFNLPPLSSAPVNMKGRLENQSENPEGLAAVTEVFTNYLSGKDSILVIRGVSGSGTNGIVGWLTAGFSTIEIENVVLPGPDQVPELIPAITMKNLQLDFTKDQWAPPTSSKQVEAQLKSPFGFPLTVSSLSMEVDAAYHGYKAAHLSIPEQSSTTSPTGLITTQFADVPFAVYDNAHVLFGNFVQLLTHEANVTFSLIGSSDAKASTNVGVIPLSGIQFDVETQLAGLANLEGKVTIVSLSIEDATKDYIVVGLEIVLSNPSQISIALGDVVFYVNMNEFGSQVGEVYLKDLALVPGENKVACEMHMAGTDLHALAQLLSNYMTGAVTPLTIVGKETSTPIVPLQNGLSTINLATTMTGISTKLIKKAQVYVGLDFVTGAPGDAVVTLTNPLNTKFSLVSLKVDVSANVVGKSTVIGTIDVTLSKPLLIQPGQTVESAKMPIKITNDIIAIGSLLGDALKGNLRVDLQQNVTMVVGNGFAGGMYYWQDDVVACMALDLDLIQIPLGTCNEEGTVSAASAKSNPLAALDPGTLSKIPPAFQKLLGLSPANVTTTAVLEAITTSSVAQTTLAESAQATAGEQQQPTVLASEPPAASPTQEATAAAVSPQAAAETTAAPQETTKKSIVDLIWPF